MCHSYIKLEADSQQSHSCNRIPTAVANTYFLVTPTHPLAGLNSSTIRLYKLKDPGPNTG